MSNLAIIPARGGSKRIPRKNIKDFSGKPIIAYSIEVALKSGLFDEVMVSTDDDEIAQIARAYGAKVPFIRSGDNSNDFATTLSVVEEVVDRYASERNRKFDFVCCIYPTAPMIQSQHLIDGLDLIKTDRFDSVFPVVKFSYPIWRSFSVQPDGKIEMLWPQHLTSRSQDLQEIFHDAGQWYWLKSKLINGSIFTNNSGALTISEEFVQDIDTESDWLLAELKFKRLKTPY